ncbi:uncharacterized protein CEXT_791921 [Caerostris extrusa]|uniref:Uncharacterized protein n=1 Tax=Caerostris extrusa TaxID=172846 RepID=A0AAV4RHL6_CAEEX|nr:uncharacterized protein CEXT_791921 [Caerostris extrusa]
MEVNLNKSYCLTFSLMHRTLDLQLKYKSIQIPLCDNFKYLGVTFERKLTWKHHVEDISNHAMKRLSALKRLSGARWGCSGQTMLQTYHTFILSLLTYCCEPLVATGENVLVSLEKIQNQSLRIVAGAVKSTPIDAMLMLTADKPLRTVIQENAFILWEKIIRVPGCFSLWNEVKQDLIRNFKTQMGFLQLVLQLKIHLV